MSKKVHAIVARCTFPSQNVQSTPAPDHFWHLRCRKSARRCGAKHISKSKCTKHTSFRTTFGSWDVEKVHAVVARSTFRSQNVKNTRGSDHFWKLRCWKSHAVVARSTFPSENVQNTPCTARTIFGGSDVEKVHAIARRCGAKHISKSKCTKHTMYGPCLEVQMSKKCTPLWREAHFQVKMYKAHHVRTIFGGLDVVSRGRRKGLWTLSKVSKTWGFCSIFNHNHHYITLHDTPIHYTTLQLQLLHLHYILLHSTTLHRTQLHSTTLLYTTLPSVTLHHTTLHSITLHFTTLHYNYNCTTTLH